MAEAEVDDCLVVRPHCSELWQQDRGSNGFLIRKNVHETALDCRKHCRDQRLADSQCAFQVVEFFLQDVYGIPYTSSSSLAGC